MALTRLGGANAITGVIPVANGGTGLASGTTDQFLKFTGTTTLASAADNAGAMVHLQTTTLSSDTTQIDFSNVFSATYKSYLFVFNQLKSKSTSDYFIGRFFTDTGTTAYTSSNYEIATGYARAASGADNDASGTSWSLGYARFAGNVFHQNTPGSGHLYVHNPFDSGNRVTMVGHLGVHDGTYHVSAHYFGMVAANTQFYGMRFLTTSSDLGDGTSISLYGLANS
jgi:hypothetical protein